MYVFKKWNEAIADIRAARKVVEDNFNRGAISRFHYHGFIVMVDGQKTGDADEGPLTLKSLKRLVDEYTPAEKEGKQIEISIEGHWDMFDSYQDKLTSGGDYYPADDYINITVYKTTNDVQ